MRTNVENVFNFPGWAQRLGTGSISWRMNSQFRIQPQFWMQQIRIKRVTVTIEQNDRQNTFNHTSTIKPDQYRNFILNNCNQYTELVINFSGFTGRDLISWNPHNILEPINLNGIKLKKITFNQNGMTHRKGNSIWGLGAYEAFQGYDAVITEFQ